MKPKIFSILAHLPLTCAVFVAAVLWPLTMAHAQTKPDSAADEARQKLQSLKNRLNRVRSREKGVEHNVTSLSKERASLNRSLIDTAGQIQESETSLSSIEDKLDGLGEQENIIRGSLATQHQSIGRLLAAMQRIGRQPPPVIVTPRKDALQMVRSAMLLAAIFPQLRTQASELSQKLSDLIRISTSIRLQRDRLKIENKKLNKNRLTIKTLLAEKRARLSARKSQLASLHAAAQQHAKNVANLADLITSLSAEVEKNSGLGNYERELKSRQNQRQVMNSSNTNAKNTTVDAESGTPATKSTKTAFLNPGRIKPARPFAEIKGAVLMPVRGRRLTSFGARDRFGARSKGIVLQTRKNAQITSPADGWIVYAGSYRSYGQLLIINAGGGYHVLLAGMTNIDVTLGQFVVAGEPVAAMGAGSRRTAGRSKSKRPVLYIEFRKDGQPINPAPWFGKGRRKVQG